MDARVEDDRIEIAGDGNDPVLSAEGQTPVVGIQGGAYLRPGLPERERGVHRRSRREAEHARGLALIEIGGRR